MIACGCVGVLNLMGHQGGANYTPSYHASPCRAFRRVHANFLRVRRDANRARIFTVRKMLVSVRLGSVRFFFLAAKNLKADANVSVFSDALG